MWHYNFLGDTFGTTIFRGTSMGHYHVLGGTGVALSFFVGHLCGTLTFWGTL